MSRIPSLKPWQVVAALERIGFVVIRIVGSHYQLSTKKRADTRLCLTIIAICHAERWERLSSRPDCRGTNF
jgi:predicted RNA binding protein YcfA (HicA-like mRNA interferase family)